MLISRLLNQTNKEMVMPYDSEGNFATTQSFAAIKTLHDVIVTDKKDVIPLRVGGVATVAQDTGEGVELTTAPA